MKRRLRVDRLIILMILLVFIVGLAILGIKMFFNEDDNTQNDTPTINKEGIQLDLMDYSIYQTEDLNFDFAILKIRLQDDKAINFSLNRLATDEIKDLSKIDSYKTQLEKEGYYLSTIPVDFSLESTSNSQMFHIFVPYTKDLDVLRVYNLEDGTFFDVDLKSHLEDLSGLYYHTGGNVSDGKSYDINVSDPSSANTLYKNGQEYTVASTIKVFSFKLIINQLSESNITIEDAIFVPKDSNEAFKALDASFETMKLENIIGKPLFEKDSYGLFFEVYAPDESGITYDGVLKLKFSNNPEWVEIHTVLD